MKVKIKHENILRAIDYLERIGWLIKGEDALEDKKAVKEFAKAVAIASIDIEVDIDMIGIIKKEIDMRPKKKRSDHTCGECSYRDLGTDTHYVCHNNLIKKLAGRNVVRVNKNRNHCVAFKSK
jgi:hypothetical protein